MSINLRALNDVLPLVLNDNNLYYESPPYREYLFRSTELAPIHRSLGHAPPEAAYSSLRRAYPI